ncbi:MAG TPA: CoA pyrophosphatase [Planctomycetota bacterium]|nr:CoA pyrophosphatase [Planctomycetota bacterium]
MRIPDETVRGRLELPLGDWRTVDGLRDSAVLAILVERGGEDFLVFNRRRDDLPWHAGQICFPGGAREGGEDATACAVRETCEEMGLGPSDLALLGRMPDRVSIAGFLVSPFVARLQGTPDFRAAADEVAEVFEVPVKLLRDGTRWGYTETTHKRARFRKVPCFDFDESHRIWGLTGIILRDFVTQVMGFAPPS